jgi:hypothetical protein
MDLVTRVVDSPTFHAARIELGTVYFIRDKERDSIKIGYSADPWRRLSELQVGNSTRLELIGIIAAEARVEKIVHEQLCEGHIGGEWFWDRGVTSEWLMNMTRGLPLCRNVWRLEPSKTFFADLSDPQ